MKLTAETFLTVLKRSELVKPERMKRLMTEIADSDVDINDANALASALVKRNLLTSWQADKLLHGKSRGFFLGKYRLLSLLGKGGMSSVYLAEHVLMRRRCAVKVLPQKRVNDTSYLGRFHREAQAVAALDHPNIVRAYDVDVDRNIEKNHEIHFLVMEYVEGRSLQELIQEEGPIDAVRTADFLRQAADGLEHAHQAGMVHRDVKPGNLLVDNNGIVRILDLGLARFFDDQDEESLTVAHDEKVLGTADYLAPEQALDSHKVDARADIYSLGCTAYFLLTGHPPFTEGTLAQRLMAHQTKEPAAIEAERAEVSAGLLKIIRKMMSKDADDRHQTAADASEDLFGWLQAEGGEDWKRRMMSAAGSDVVGSGHSASTTDTKTIQGSPTPLPVGGDDNLAAFLTKLESDPSIDVVSPSGIARKRGQKAGRSSTVAAVETVPPSAAAEPKPTPTRPPVPVAATPPLPSTRKSEPAPEESSTVDSPSATGIASLLKQKRVRIAGLAIAAVLLLGGIGWGIVAIVSGPSEDPDQSGQQVDNEKTGKSGTGPKVTKSDDEIVVDPKGKISTIKLALDEVMYRYDKIGNRVAKTLVIRLLGDTTYKERIVLDNSDSSLDNLTLKIVCNDSKPAILAPTGPETVVVLKHAQHFTLEGVEIKAAKAKKAVELYGHCFGLRFRRLTISGFTETGIAASELRGFQSFSMNPDDIQFQQVTIRGADAKAVGLRFSGESSWVTLAGCRFLGPLANGILYQNDCVDSAIKHCVFHGLGDGIQFRGRLRTRKLAITRNTFHDSTNGVVMTGPPADGTAEFTMSNNLFAKLKAANATVRPKITSEAFRKILPSDGSGLRGNQTDRAKPHQSDIPFLFSAGGKTGVALKFASTKPEDDNFLLPAADAAHKKVGAATFSE